MGTSGTGAGRSGAGKGRQCEEHTGFQTEGTWYAETWKLKCVCWRTAGNPAWPEASDAGWGEQGR